MAMPAGCKYKPEEEVLVGKVLRKRVRGEPLDCAAADCIREADVYGDDPARLTALFLPTNQGPNEWFFFSWCKVKGKKARCDGGGGGGGGGGGRGRGPGCGKGAKRWRKERTVRGAGGVEIGQWRSTQAVKNVTQIDGSGCPIPIGYHQNFEFRSSKKQKSDWLMEEYGILPSPSGAEAADDKELVICKIYKTPAARRAEAALPPPVPVLLPHPPPSLQPKPLQLSPPPWSALPPLLPTSWPNLLSTFWPEQPLQPLAPPPPESGTLSLPMVPLLLSAQLDMPWHDSMMVVGARTPFCPLDRDWPDVPHGAMVSPELYEAVAPFTCSSISEQQAVAEIGGDHLATYVGGDQMWTTSQIPHCTTTDISDHCTYSGNMFELLPQSDQQQQHTESDASATSHVEGSTTTDDHQPAAAGVEDEEEEDLSASLPSVLTEWPQALSDYAHNADEFFDMIEDGFLFGEMPTTMDDNLMIDDFNFLDGEYLVT